MAILIAADNLPIPGTKTSVAMLLTLFDLNVDFLESRKWTNDGYDYRIDWCTLVLMSYDT